jgi:hypothetical protein
LSLKNPSNSLSKLLQKYSIKEGAVKVWWIAGCIWPSFTFVLMLEKLWRHFFALLLALAIVFGGWPCLGVHMAHRQQWSSWGCGTLEGTSILLRAQLQ